MLNGPRDLAQIRFDNAMRLFDEFVQAHVRQADAATLRGLEGRFAERLQIQASYWSQIKARSRQIGERLARQFEERCSKPNGWLDEALALRCAGVVTNYALIDAEAMARIHGAGLRALVYTVNDPAEAARLDRLGIDGIVTDAVDRFAPGSDTGAA